MRLLAAMATMVLGMGAAWAQHYDAATDISSRLPLAGGTVTGALAVQGAFTVANFTKHIDLPAGAAVLGPTAPSVVVSGTCIGLQFDADAEVVGLTFDVPDDWVAGTDLTLHLHWHGESGDALADTETVKWDCSYRAIDWDDSETVDNGTIATMTTTYTQSGAGANLDALVSDMTMTAAHAQQPLAAGDAIAMTCDRDVTGDSYSGGAIISVWQVQYTSNTLSTH